MKSQEYVPNFEPFLQKIAEHEETLLGRDLLNRRQHLGRILVNRIYLACFVTFFIYDSRINHGFASFTDEIIHNKLYERLKLTQLLFPMTTFQLLLAQISCYQIKHDDIIRIPMIDSRLQVSSPRYSNAKHQTYRYIHVPYDYCNLPDIQILSRLLILIRQRRTLLVQGLQLVRQIVSFLLTESTDTPNLSVDDESQTDEVLLTRLVQNIFLTKLPECTPRDFANSIDALPHEFIPHLEEPEHIIRRTQHRFDRNIETLPTENWFIGTSMFNMHSFKVIEDLTVIDFLPTTQSFRHSLPQIEDTDHQQSDIPTEPKPEFKTLRFWIDVLSAP